MMPCDHDERAETLTQLIVLAPDAARAERVRVRCRTQLERHRPRAARGEAIAGFAWRVLAPAGVGAFCILYVTVLVVTTLQLKGVFH